MGLGLGAQLIGVVKLELFGKGQGIAHIGAGDDAEILSEMNLERLHFMTSALFLWLGPPSPNWTRGKAACD